MKKQYLGFKVVFGTPMNRLEYNTLRGWTLPSDENGDDEGIYTEHEGGHITWSPKEVFEEAYDDIQSEFGFDSAIFLLKKGHKLARKGWNGKDMWISVSKGSVIEAAKFWNPHNARFAKEQGGSAEVLDSITMKTADGKILMGWLASMSDMLADDWCVVE